MVVRGTALTGIGYREPTRIEERMMARRRSVAALVERVTGFEDEAAVGCSDRIASRKGAADSEIVSLH